MRIGLAIAAIAAVGCLFSCAGVGIHILSPEEQLQESIEEDDVSGVGYAIDHGAPVDWSSGPGQYRAIHIAAAHSDVKLVRRLLSRGANPNTLDPKEPPALVEAVTGAHVDPKRSIECVRLLLEYGAHSGKSDALWWSGRGAQKEVAGLLMDHGADVNYLYPKDTSDSVIRSTPLIEAVVQAQEGQRRLDYIRLLLDRGAHPDPHDRTNSNVPLQRAVFDGDVDLVRLLVQRGAKVGPPEEYVDKCCPKTEFPNQTEVLAVLAAARR